MKIFYILLLVFSTVASYAQNIVGTWSGQLDYGSQKLGIVFHISKTADGYSATADSPDQKAKGIPVHSIEYNFPDLKLKLSSVMAEYVAKVSGDTLINGTFTQNGLPLNLKLTRGEFVRSRPQEPKPPFAYLSKDITFNSKESGITLAGTITYPSVGNQFPAVILVSGSGPQNRDEEILGHKPFLLLADYLTKKGIAVLRYDDRGVGESKGDYASATMADFSNDAFGAIDYLRTLPYVDKAKIGIIGHSEGGTVAFVSAAQDSSIAFVVSMAGMAVKGSDLLLKQNEAILALENAPRTMIQFYCDVLKKVYKIVEEHTNEEIAAHYATIADTLFNKDELTLPEPVRKNALSLFSHLGTPGMRYFLSINPTESIRKMNSTPILALYCGKDCQVDADMNLAAIKKSSIDSRKLNVYRKYDNLNHLFQNCATGKTSEYMDIEETISEQVLKDIAEWILRLPRNN